MRILFLGDIVGKPGVDLVCETIPAWRREASVDIVIVNAENSDRGSGLSPAIYKRLCQAEIDCITLGDHIYRKRDIISTLETRDNIVRPCNYPAEAPGKTWALVKSSTGRKVAVVSAIGRVFMKPVDCPFHAIEKTLAEIPEDIKIRFCDFHAEATSEKQLMGRYLDGKVTAVCGTHTHVTTADEQLLPGGTAYISDVGMSGPHESILGRKIEKVMEATLTFRPVPFDVAKDKVELSGVVIDVEPKTGRSSGIRRIKITESDAQRFADEAFDD